MSTSWIPWARALVGLSPTAKLLAYELSLLADNKGVVIVQVGYLADVVSAPISAVSKALRQMESLGHMRRGGGNVRAPQRIQLIARPTNSLRELAPASAVSARPVGGDDRTGTGGGTGDGTGGGTGTAHDSTRIRDLICLAIEAGWHGPPCWDLAATLSAHGPQRFRRVINEQREWNHTTDPWDTLTLAWEIIQNHGPTVVEAKDPWALWVHLTRLAILPRQTHSDHESATEWNFGVDDFTPALHSAVSALVEAGIEETIAWAGTARIVELIDVGASRRHWLAARDAKLQALGISDSAARAWMSFVVGSRRGKKGTLTGASLASISHQAEGVATALSAET